MSRQLAAQLVLLSRSCAGVLALCCACAAAPLAAAECRITELDILSGHLDTFAYGVNDFGIAVGESDIDRSGNVANARPVRWDASGAPTLLWEGRDAEWVTDPLTGETVYQPSVFPGGVALAVNNHGQIVGRAQNSGYTGIPLPTPGIPDGVAFYWDEAGGRRVLGTFGGNSSQATAINDAGQVCGSAQDLFGLPRAFVWDAAGGMRDIGTLGGTYAFATDINNAGQIVGYSGTPSGSEHAFLWDPVAGMQDLGQGLSRGSRAWAINSVGDVAGNNSTAGAAFWPRTGEPILLANPIAQFGDALGVNEHGVVVGHGNFLGAGAGAQIWDAVNGARLLDSLITNGDDWHLSYASSINERGQIVGHGLTADQVRGYLLTPVPEPQTLALGTAATLCMIGFRSMTAARGMKAAITTRIG